MPDDLTNRKPPITNLVEDVDFYYEGPYVVFTAEYLRRRGYCCGSGCRHCPYSKQEREDAEQKRSEKNFD